MRHTRMPWTREEEEELRTLILSGKSLEAIAKKLNRTLRAIQTRAYKLNLPLKKVY
jgi:DNA-binding NarL/FixJ family response regulator